MVHCPIIDQNKFQPLKNDLIRSITIFNHQKTIQNDQEHYIKLPWTRKHKKNSKISNGRTGWKQKKQVKSFR